MEPQKINNYIVDAASVKDKINNIRLNGISRGKHCGFSNLYKHYSVKPGCMTFIMGAPDTGKTFFLYELLINLSWFHGWNHLIFSPEMGNAEDIYGYLIEMVMGKHLGTLTEFEYNEGLEFVRDKFYVIDPQDAPFPVLGLFEQADLIESTLVPPKKFHTISGDPFNEFDHDFRDDYNRQDLYIERVLGLARRKSKVSNRHLFLVTHSRDIQKVEKNGKRFFPIPTAHDYAGGAAWYRKGLAMIAFWRPPMGEDNFELNEHVFSNNEVLVRIQKAKPRGVGEKGDVYMYFDFMRQRFYEESTFSGKQYARNFLGESEIIETKTAPF